MALQWAQKGKASRAAHDGTSNSPVASQGSEKSPTELAHARAGKNVGRLQTRIYGAHPSRQSTGSVGIAPKLHQEVWRLCGYTKNRRHRRGDASNPSFELRKRSNITRLVVQGSWHLSNGLAEIIQVRSLKARSQETSSRTNIDLPPFFSNFACNSDSMPYIKMKSWSGDGARPAQLETSPAKFNGERLRFWIS